ncbi:MAG: tRNA (guanosine(37)-N1)-methyltransferase TrmD [Myxococcales bacterium]|nr:tRNA (guanosine(37)-N1)-methyltransferase TrmD [Myxococcales bacterium]
MRFEILTLFPEIFGSFLATGLMSKARDAKLLEIELISPRTFATDKHRTVDDAPYGGGSGMLMQPGPLVAALEHLDSARAGASTRRVLLTPQGVPFTQAAARRLSAEPCLTFVCGRYEGVDERVRARMDEEISLGDFVLLGGEVGAMAVLEAVSRLLPGVLGNDASVEDESHVAGLLEYPQYTRPADFRGEPVPAILLSGDHGAIARWRRGQALLRTRTRRPDLWNEASLSAEDQKLLRELDLEDA